ncbi:MAG: DUF998 domain-containing protein [Thermocrispum sp.]
MTDAKQLLVRSYLFLRRGLGLIGMALPFVLVVGNLLAGGGLLGSISQYYHSDLRDFYVGALCAIGVFLLFYRGYERSDRTASIVAGVAAIGSAVFPIASDPADGAEEAVGVVHVVLAAVLFLTFAYFCLVEFRKTGVLPPTPRKLQRNQVYLVTGAIILGCLVLVVVVELLGVLGQLRPVLWLEAIATVAFGVAWLTKGEAILGDLGGPRQ